MEKQRAVKALGLTEEEFRQWRDQPTTAKVMRYLEDRQASVQDLWRRGLEWTEDSRRHVQDLQDFRDLAFDDIANHYGTDEEEQAPQ